MLKKSHKLQKIEKGNHYIRKFQISTLNFIFKCLLNSPSDISQQSQKMSFITCGMPPRSLFMRPKLPFKSQHISRTNKIMLNSTTSIYKLSHNEILNTIKFPIQFKYTPNIKHGLHYRNIISYASSSETHSNGDFHIKRKKENFLISFFKRIVTWIAFVLLAASNN